MKWYTKLYNIFNKKEKKNTFLFIDEYTKAKNNNDNLKMTSLIEMQLSTCKYADDDCYKTPCCNRCDFGKNNKEWSK